MAFLTGDRFVEAEKVTHYLLDRAHPRGGSKAVFFEAFGFDRARPDELIAALSQHPADNPIAKTEKASRGLRIVVECGIPTPDGRNPCIRSVWALDHDATTYRLITAYPNQ